jgi:hypothetical protein
MTDFKAKYSKYKLKYLELKKSLETSGGYYSYPSYKEVVVLTINNIKKLTKFIQVITDNNNKKIIRCYDKPEKFLREFDYSIMSSAHLTPTLKKTNLNDWWNFNNEIPV